MNKGSKNNVKKQKREASSQLSLFRHIIMNSISHSLRNKNLEVLNIIRRKSTKKSKLTLSKRRKPKKKLRTMRNNLSKNSLLRKRKLKNQMISMKKSYMMITKKRKEDNKGPRQVAIHEGEKRWRIRKTKKY